MAGGPSTVELVVASAARRRARLPGRRVQDGGRPGGGDGGRPGRRRRRVRREPVRPGRPDRRSGGPGRLRRRSSSPTPPPSGRALGEAAWDDDDYAGQGRRGPGRAAAPRSASPSASPPPTSCARCRRPGPLVLLTVTTPEEADAALRVGPDALCLQGAEAGAHRGSLANDDRPDQDRPVRALLAAVRRRTLVPLVAAGGVGGPGDVADLLARGADLVQAGTAFLRCPESGAPAPQKDALADPAFEGDRGHPGLQRPAGPRPGQRHGAGAPGAPGRLPRDQQRHAAPACRGGPGRRPAAHEPVRRDGLPRGPRRGRRPRWSSGWCQDVRR